MEIEKLFSRQSSKVVWAALTATGEPVLNDDQWLISKDRLQLFDGYECCRIVKAGDLYLRIYCSVSKSHLGNLLFTCRACDASDDSEVFTMTSLKSTTAANCVLDRIGVKTNKKWSGTKFFGFDRKDVQLILSSKKKNILINKNSKQNNIQTNTEVLGNTAHNLHLHENFTWLGVKHLGNIVTGQFSSFFIREYQGKSFQLPDGYISIHAVKCGSKFEEVTCKVKAVGSSPEFTCEIETKSIIFTEHCVSKVVTQVLNFIQCSGKRKWSGYDFFGFYRNDVLKSLYVNTCIMAKRLDAPLQSVANIRSRNGGPTGELKSKQAKDKRNEIINKIVDYTSYGDVTSK